METVWNGKVYNYVIVYIDTVIFGADTIEEAIKMKNEVKEDSFYLQKDKIFIYVKLNY